MSKSAPEAPDYVAAAEAQGDSSRENLATQTYANRPELNTPWGNMTWDTFAEMDPATQQEVTRWVGTLNLSPAQQEALDSQMRIQAARSGGAEALLSGALNSLGVQSTTRTIPGTPAQGTPPPTQPAPSTTPLTNPFDSESTSAPAQPAMSYAEAEREYMRQFGSGMQADEAGWGDQWRTDRDAFIQERMTPQPGTSGSGLSSAVGNLAQRGIDAIQGGSDYIPATPDREVTEYTPGPGIDYSGIAEGGSEIDPITLQRRTFDTAPANRTLDTTGVPGVTTELGVNPFSLTGTLGDTTGGISGTIANTNLGIRAPTGDFSSGFVGAGGINLDTSLSPERFSLSDDLDAIQLNDQMSSTAGEWRQKAQDAALAFMDPLHQQEQSRLENQLANMGLQRGTEAWDRELQRLSDQHTRNRLQAFAEGRAESDLLFGQDLASSQFTNDSRVKQQGINQSVAEFKNSVAGQDLARRIAEGEFGNDAKIAMGVAERDAARVTNEAARSKGDLSLRATEIANAAQNQEFNQAATRTAAQNAAQQQEFNQILARGNFQNEAQKTSFDQALKQGVFENTAQAQAYAQALSNGVFENTAQQQEFENLMREAQYGDQQAIQELNANVQAGKYNELLRQQDIAELLQKRIQPLNELNALLSGQQVANPQMPTFNPAGVAQPTQYLNAADMGYQADLNAFNAEQAGLSGLTSGLFSLGSAAMGAPGGWSNLFKFT